MASTITVPYEEIIDGVAEGINSRGPWARKKYLVAWNDRYQFATDMRGNSSTTGPAGPWIRVVPFQYPPSPGLYAMELEIEPKGDVVGHNPIAFTYAIITVSFGVPEFGYQTTDDPQFLQSVTDDPTENTSLQYCTQKITYGYETYPIPSSSVAFPSDGKKSTTPAVVRVPVTTIILIYHDYPRQIFKTLRAIVGAVNDATFLGCGVETLFLESIESDPHATSTGVKVQDIAMTFKYRALDWNQFLRPDKIAWEQLKDNTGAKIYTKKDFKPLLLK